MKWQTPSFYQTKMAGFKRIHGSLVDSRSDYLGEDSGNLVQPVLTGDERS